MIHFVVQYLGDYRLEAVGEDSAGHRRKIEVEWMTKGPDVAPRGWSQQVEAEMKHQLDLEAEIESGRKLPW